MEKRLLLLRHARHAASIHQIFLGSTDIGLAERGRVEAASIVPLLDIYQPERCFCSPLKRCIETIRPISSLKIEIVPELREVDFGNWEEKTFEQIQRADPEAVNQWADFDPEFSFPGGERLADFQSRVQHIADLLASCPEKTILAVTHAGIIRALICHYLGLNPRQYLLFNIKFASLTTLDLFEGKGVLTSLNQRYRTEEP